MPPKETTPPRLPDTTPRSPYGGDYSYMEIIMAMQNTMGKLTTAVDTLVEKTNKHEEKLDKISHRVYAAAAIVSIFAVVAGFVLNKLADAVIAALKIAK